MHFMVKQVSYQEHSHPIQPNPQTNHCDSNTSELCNVLEGDLKYYVFFYSVVGISIVVSLHICDFIVRLQIHN